MLIRLLWIVIRIMYNMILGDIMKFLMWILEVVVLEIVLSKIEVWY